MRYVWYVSLCCCLLSWLPRTHRSCVQVRRECVVLNASDSICCTHMQVIFFRVSAYRLVSSLHMCPACACSVMANAEFQRTSLLSIWRVQPTISTYAVKATHQILRIGASGPATSVSRPEASSRSPCSETVSCLELPRVVARCRRCLRPCALRSGGREVRFDTAAPATLKIAVLAQHPDPAWGVPADHQGFVVRLGVVVGRAVPQYHVDHSE